MISSYRQQVLTFCLILSVIVGAGVSETFAQGKRATAPKGPKVGSETISATENTSAISPESVLLTENFDYTAATALTANGWTEHSAGINPINVSAPGLTYPGYAGSGVGNAVTMAGTGQDVSRSFTAVTSGTLYAAFLVNFSATTTTGDYFFHVMNFGTTTFRGRVFAKKDAANTNFAFGLSRTNGTAVFTGTTYTPGTTYLVVVKYEYTAAADTVQLFVNPTPGAAEPASATLTATDADSAEPAQLNGVGLRQGGTSSGSTQQVDGIRVATTWAEAVASGGPVTTPQAPNVDMNGDGRTDFVVTRQSAPGANFTSRFADGASRGERRRERLMRTVGEDSLAGGSSQFEWWIDYNNAPGGTAGVWGLAQVDFTVNADFDGDNKDDVAIWRPGVPGEAGFYSINSSDGTFRYSDFGLTGDDSTVVGDYDGDGFDDPATFRCPDSVPGQCYFFYRGSLNNPTNGITYIPWGFGTIIDYYPNPGDFNGDGKYDFCVQDIKPDTEQATFWLWLNGTETREATQWGLDSDFVVPGDFDGDGKSDYAVLRPESGKFVFYILERDGGMRGVQWGIDGDIPAPGDYDGDGKQDIAVYRWNTTDSTFWILPSNGDPYWTTNWGVPLDEPLAGWYVQ